MSEHPISRFPVPALAELPADIRARIEEVQQKAGFVPNVFITLAHRPDEFRAFFAYHDALLLKEGGLSKAEREQLAAELRLLSSDDDTTLHLLGDRINQ